MGKEKGAEKRAEQRAGTAEQRDPAQYAGGDGFHLQPAAGLIRHKTNLRGEDNPGAGRQHAVEGKGQHPRAIDRHAQLARGGEVIADGVKITTKGGARQQPAARQQQRQHQPAQRRHADKRRLRERLQAVGQALDPFPAGPQQHHPAIQPQRAEGGDDRRNAQSHYQQAVKRPGQRANRQRKGDSRRQPVTVVQRHADGDGAQPNGGAYRHVNIAGQHHQRRAQCQQAKDLRAGENHRQGLQAEIGWIERHQHGKERHDGKEGAQFAILQ